MEKKGCKALKTTTPDWENGDPETGHQTHTIKKCILKLRSLGKRFIPSAHASVAVEDKKAGATGGLKQRTANHLEDPSHETGSSSRMTLQLISL